MQSEKMAAAIAALSEGLELLREETTTKEIKNIGDNLRKVLDHSQDAVPYVNPQYPEKTPEEFKELVDEIDRISHAEPNYKHKPYPIITIQGDRDESAYDIKALGSRFAYFATRLGCKSYPVDTATGKPYKRGIYVSDGDCYFDLVEALNRLLDILGAPQ